MAQGGKIHDHLHGFQKKMGCGTDIMEAKICSSWPSLISDPFFGLFLDLRNMYHVMDRNRCPKILEDCEAGFKARC